MKKSIYWIVVIFSIFCLFNCKKTDKLELPPYVDLFQYAKVYTYNKIFDYGNYNYDQSITHSVYTLGTQSIRMWGWSKNGMVAYSQETGMEGRGGTLIQFIIFDFINDKKLFELEIDTFDHDEIIFSYDNDNFEKEFNIYMNKMYNIIKDEIREAMKRFNIIEKQVEYLPFPIKKDNNIYDAYCIITPKKDEEKEYGDIENIKSYSIIIKKNKEEIKTITKNDDAFAQQIYIGGYFLSPFENRALVVIAVESFTFEGTGMFFIFSGCHLETGFHLAKNSK